ncbi:MAG: HAMP domain-containing histidine kinase [Chitinophagaceae bacterium]|nr:HAMP domain-containing histidine kinase [Chitinophagaceae bacterium]
MFLILTVFFFILSLKPVQNFLKGTYNIQTVRNKIEKQLHLDIELARKSLTDDIVTDLHLHRFESKHATEFLDSPYDIYLFEHDSLIFWTNNHITPKIQKNKKIIPYQHYEGSYVQYELPKGAHGTLKILLLLPVKEDLHNANNKRFFDALGQDSDYGFDIQTAYHDGYLPIRVENEVPYYLMHKQTPVTMNDHVGWQLFLSALPFIFMGISIHTYYKVIVQHRSRHWIFLLVVLTAVGLRAFNLYTGIPNNFSEFSAFSNTVFYNDPLSRSLGDTFVNFCLLFWILLFYIMNVQGSNNDNKFFKRLPWFFIIKSIFLTLLAIYQIHLISSIILNTEITFDTTLFSSIDYLSFIGILTCMVGMANLLLLCLIFSNRCNSYKLNPWIKYGLVCLLYFSSLLLFYKKINLEGLHFLFILAIVLLILMDHRKMRIRFDFNSYELILWIIIFSLISTQFLILTIEQKEKNNRVILAERIASQFIPEQLSVPVFQLKEAVDVEYNQQKIPLQDSTTYLNELYYRYLRNIADQFEIKVESFPAVKMDSVITFLKTTSILHYNSDSLFCESNQQETKLYFVLKPYRDADIYSVVRLFKKLDEFSIVENYAHQVASPNKEIEYDYTVGVYKDAKLIASSGNQAIRSTLPSNTIFKTKNQVFKDAGSNSELWYQHNKGNLTVLISKDYSVFSRFLTLFACLFFVYFSVVSLYILGNIIARSNLVKKRFINLLNVNLRLRIHSTIILVILLSFVAVGYFTSYYLISHYKTNSNNKAIEKMASVKNSLLSTFQNQHDSLFTLPNIILACENLSRENGVPINLFDYHSGQLIHSTARLLNDISFRVSFISPKAFSDFKQKNLEFVSLSETKKESDYYATYGILSGPKNKHSVILQLPYQNSRIYFQQETFSVIVTLINTFVVVFLISSFIALLITNSVVQPFTYIVRQFTKINLSKTNEPLTWQYNDEIGLLVREYNRMLRKLENSSQLLARSEREMAWREMAKQVAHEIKNPLTPMKLSMQMLDKAIREGKPNIMEMTQRVTRTIIEQIETLSVIATNFSTLARMPENKNEVIHLNEVLSSVTGMYNSDAKNEFDFIIPSYDIQIFADKTQLIRVFTNIIQNAIQAIPEDNKGMITLRVKKIKDNFVRISISDDGMGIDKEKQERLFQPYFTTKTSGTGLGLAMCKDIIEQLNGRITFESALQKGTTFFIDLPIYDLEG